MSRPNVSPLDPAEARGLQTYLVELFERYGLSVGVGLAREGVAIRSQDPRVDAANIGVLEAFGDD